MKATLNLHRIHP